MTLGTDTIVEGLVYALPAVAFFIAFRYAGFPDLTIEGSFALGAAISVAMADNGMPYAGILCALLAGLGLGALTGAIFVLSGTDRLIAGIVGMVLGQTLALVLAGSTRSIAESTSILFASRRLDNWLTRDVLGRTTGVDIEVFTACFLSAIVILVTWMVIRISSTKTGYRMRALRSGSDLLERTGYGAKKYFVMSLATANILAAFGGVLYGAHTNGFDASTGFGAVLIAIIAVLLGEWIYRLRFKQYEVIPHLTIPCVVVGSILWLGIVLVIAQVFLNANLASLNPNLRRAFNMTLLALLLIVSSRKKYIHRGAL